MEDNKGEEESESSDSDNDDSLIKVCVKYRFCYMTAYLYCNYIFHNIHIQITSMLLRLISAMWIQNILFRIPAPGSKADGLISSNFAILLVANGRYIMVTAHCK